MGRKVHPYGFRLGTSRTWNAKWYADKNYTALLKEDITIRQLVTKRLANASVSLVDIERGINHVTVTVQHGQAGHRHRQGRRERRGAAPADRPDHHDARSSWRSRRSASPSSTPSSSRPTSPSS